MTYLVADGCCGGADRGQLRGWNEHPARICCGGVLEKPLAAWEI